MYRVHLIRLVYFVGPVHKVLYPNLTLNSQFVYDCEYEQKVVVTSESHVSCYWAEKYRTNE